MLCLGGVAPALAATDPPPIPQPISDAVQQVSKATGLPNPLPPSEPAPRHHRTTTPAAAPAPTTTTQHAATRQVTTTSRPSAAAVAVAMPTSAVLTREAHLSTNAPAVAPPTRIAPASSMAALPAPLTSNDAPRILLVAIATMVLGALAGGHIKAAQAYVFAHGALAG